MAVHRILEPGRFASFLTPPPPLQHDSITPHPYALRLDRLAAAEAAPAAPISGAEPSTSQVETSFYRLLFELRVDHATGMLRVSDGRVRKIAYLERGQPVFVSSNDDSERFGRFLVRRGVLHATELAAALAAMPADNYRLTDTLERLGLLEPAAALIHVREQQMERLVDLMGWPSARSTFVEGATYAGDRLDLMLDIGELLVRAVTRIPMPAVVRRLSRRMHQSARLALHLRSGRHGLDLTPTGERLVRALDGQRALVHVVRSCAPTNATQREALQVLYLLHELGALEFSQ